MPTTSSSARIELERVMLIEKIDTPGPHSNREELLVSTYNPDNRLRQRQHFGLWFEEPVAGFWVLVVEHPDTGARSEVPLANVRQFTRKANAVAVAQAAAIKAAR